MTVRFVAIPLALAAALLLPPVASAQWVQQDEQFYLQAPHNWVFRDRYQAADRLFNAFDFGHAILYEKLWTEPGAPASNLEVEQYDLLTKKILVNPPRLPLEEGAIEVAYVKLAPEAKLMFEWAHVLHRQLYDVLADERLSDARKDAEVARVLAYYKTRPDLAFSSRPKTMELMQEQPYSLAFRRKYPKFNGLIWAYHWLQIGLYEPLLAGQSPEERQSLVRATVARFWQMLERPVEGMPHVMPMTAVVSPRFAERFPEASIIFDNLHSMHDVISDILANPAVPRDRKRAEILLAARRFRDDTSFVTTEEGWREMARHMGLENMGGPAVGFLPALPTPSVTYGAVMTHDPLSGVMTGFAYGAPVGGEHAQHGAAADTAHVGHQMAPPARDTGGHGAHDAPHRAADTTAAALHMRMMSDPVIMQRVMADTAMHRLMTQMMQDMPAGHRMHMQQMMQDMPARHRMHMQQMMHGDTAAAPDHAGHGAEIRVQKQPVIRRAATPRPAAKPAAKKPAAKKPAAKKPAPKPAPRPADPHAGHRPAPAKPDPHAGHRPPGGS